MNEINAISLPQPSALRSQGWEVEVEVISTDLSDEQRALVIQVKQLSAVVHMAGLERAKRFRLLRESFPKVPPGAKENPGARKGWAEFLRREFDANVRNVNYEIAAIEAAGEKLDETDGSPANHLKLQEIGSSHLGEIGVGSTPAIRAKVWDKLLSGELSLSKRTIRAEVKLLNSDAGQLQLATKRPAGPGSRPPKAPSPTAAGLPSGGKVWSIEKWCNGEKTRPRMEKELNYLGGADAPNEKFNADLTALVRKASGGGSVGKVARIQALAAALHREFKSLSDRYQREQEHDRDFKRYMTVWQHHWADTSQHDLHAELDRVREDLNEVNRHFEISVQLSWADDVKLAE
jgi:hypothetical protein